MKQVELPRTGHEVLMRMFPFMDELVAQDVEHIRENHPEIQTVSMLAPAPGTPNGVEAIFDGYFGWNARRLADKRGLAPEEIEQQLRDRLSMGGPEAEQISRSLQMEYAASLNFRLSGEKVFYVTDALSERLAHTEANLRCDHLNLPFPSFSIVFTSKIAIDLHYNLVGADGRSMGSRKEIDYEAPLTTFVTRLPADAEHPERLLLIVLHARELPRGGPALHALSSREMNLDPDWDIEAAIRTDWKALEADQGAERAHPSGVSNSPAQSDELFYRQGYAFYRMVMNTILYLTSKNAEREALPSASDQLSRAAAEQASSKQRKRLERRARYVSDAPFEMVGRNVQPIAFGEGGKAKTSNAPGGRKIERRFLVRGHWRAQPVGVGRQDRRTIFIEPYYKGPDISETINRPYLVREEGRQIVGDDDLPSD